MQEDNLDMEQGLLKYSENDDYEGGESIGEYD